MPPIDPITYNLDTLAGQTSYIFAPFPLPLTCPYTLNYVALSPLVGSLPYPLTFDPILQKLTWNNDFSTTGSFDIVMKGTLSDG